MPPPADVHLGPRTRRLIDRSVWSASSVFPSGQDWADDTERILAFLEAQGVLDAFLRRLLAREWEGAFAEARVGYFFKCNGFKILEWEPLEVPDHPGDIDIQWMDSEPIFVEVKGPGWEGVLAPEVRNDRKLLPKYINGEARFVDTAGPLVRTIDKAIPKFSAARTNIVAIVDDLFISPLELPLDFLEAKITHHLTKTECARVGGVLFLYPVKVIDRPLEYRHYFIGNSAAGRPLPDPVMQGLIAGNWRDR
jgi:hypothetical protein